MIGFFGALLGGAVARFVIRYLETEEREREGAFSALLGLALSYELIESYPDVLPPNGELANLESLRQDSVQLLINAAGKAHKDLRGDLYILGRLIQRGFGSLVPTKRRKARMMTYLTSLEARIKRSYLGGLHLLKELLVSLEEDFDSYTDDKQST